MEDFRLDFNCALDRVGDKTIFFRLFKDSRHSLEIVGGGNHDSGFNHHFGYLVTAPGYFLQLSLGCRGKANQRHLRILRDGEKREHIAGV